MNWSEEPWKIEQYFEPYNSHMPSYNIVSDEQLIVAKLGTGGKEIKSNANLIAAAPELYYALSDLLYAIENFDRVESYIIEYAIHILEKARGE